jgi:NADPH:quinone reductase
MASGAFAKVPERQNIKVVRGVGASPREIQEFARAALAEAAARRLQPLVGQTFRLERAAEAHAAIEQRQTLGKTLLTV